MKSYQLEWVKGWGRKTTLCVVLGLASTLCYSYGEGAIPLVQDGKATGVIVVPAEVNPFVLDAAQVFVETVEASTGAKIPIVTEEEAGKIGDDLTRLYLGACQQNLAQGLDPSTLPEETYKSVARGKAIHLIGSEKAVSRATPEGKALAWVSRPTLWGLNRILEEKLQVRWIWPGKLGTFIPKHKTLEIEPGEVAYQPKLLMRTLRVRASRPLAVDSEVDARLKSEAGLWVESHGAGSRGDIPFRTVFSGWWQKYSALNPDYFADLGKIKQPYMKPERVKLRLSNPKVIEQIAEEYIAAGKPKYYSICPNDGSGFGIEPETRAWDIPQNQSERAIITARGELTARYVKFWNLVYKRLVEINPDVILTTYAYSSYRKPPPPERPLTARALLKIVATYDRDSYDLWKGWAEQAEGLFLRPNWWHLGGDAPYMPLKETYDYVKFTFDHGLMGIDMDSIIGYWGTQSPVYYLVARLMTRPELTLDEILDEYTSAFGKGAPKIREYIDYWQKVTSDYDFPLNAAPDSKRDNDPSNKYFALVKEGKVPVNILNGAKYVLPYLYGENVIAPAEQMLEEAEALIGESDETGALERVQFLRKGLLSLRASRDQVARGQRLKERPSEKLLSEFKEGSDKLDKLRSELAKEHVLWDGNIANHENSYRVLIRPKNLGHHNINLDGM